MIHPCAVHSNGTDDHEEGHTALRRKARTVPVRSRSARARKTPCDIEAPVVVRKVAMKSGKELLVVCTPLREELELARG